MRTSKKLGVAVLKDRNGVIELDVPVQGDLDDPGFRLDRVIGRTLMITLTKTLSSPFSLLGGLVGGKAEEMSSFDFAPGSSAIARNATNGLQKLSKALYERPGLEVEIQGSVSPEVDGLAIRKQKLHRQLQQVRWEELLESAKATTKPEDIQLSPDLRIAALRKHYVEVFPDEARSSRPPPGLEESFYNRMTAKLLERCGAVKGAIEQAIDELRGGAAVDRRALVPRRRTRVPRRVGRGPRGRHADPVRRRGRQAGGLARGFLREAR